MYSSNRVIKRRVTIRYNFFISNDLPECNVVNKRGLTNRLNIFISNELPECTPAMELSKVEGPSGTISSYLGGSSLALLLSAASDCKKVLFVKNKK